MVFNNVISDLPSNDMINQGIPDIRGLVEISKATAIENILTEYYKKIFNLQLEKNICKNEALVNVYEEYLSLKNE
jgi:hypothetical protein